MRCRLFPIAVVLLSVLTVSPGAESDKLGDLRGVYQASFNHDATRVVALTRDGHVGLWDIASGDRISGDFGFDPATETYVMSGDSRLVIVGFKDGRSRVFDASSAKAISPPLDVALRGQAAAPVFFSPTNEVAVCFKEKEALVFQLASGQRLATIPTPPGPSEDTPGSAVFAANGAECFIMDGGGTVARFDTKEWKARSKPMRHPAADSGYNFYFSVSDDGKWLATYDSPGENGPKGYLQVWDVEAGKAVAKPIVAVNGLAGRFIGRNRLLVLPGRGQATVRELPSMKIVYTLRPHDDIEGPNAETSPDHKWLLAWGSDRRLDLLDTETGKLAHNYGGPAAIAKVLMAPDSSSCYVVFDNNAFLTQGYYDNYIVRLSFPDLEVKSSLRITDYLLGTFLSPDGKRIMIQQGVTDKERLLFFDAATLKPLP